MFPFVGTMEEEHDVEPSHHGLLRVAIHFIYLLPEHQLLNLLLCAAIIQLQHNLLQVTLGRPRRVKFVACAVATKCVIRLFGRRNHPSSSMQ